eukprot:358671-Chlamydomonas_euryale.AAC.1
MLACMLHVWSDIPVLYRLPCLPTWLDAWLPGWLTPTDNAAASAAGMVASGDLAQTQQPQGAAHTVLVLAASAPSLLSPPVPSFLSPPSCPLPPVLSLLSPPSCPLAP